MKRSLMVILALASLAPMWAGWESYRSGGEGIGTGSAEPAPQAKAPAKTETKKATGLFYSSNPRDYHGEDAGGYRHFSEDEGREKELSDQKASFRSNGESLPTVGSSRLDSDFMEVPK